LHHFWSLIPVLIVLLLTKFGLAIVIYIGLERKVIKSLDVLFMLFGTMKNGGAAIAITTLLFGLEATVPFAIDGIILPFYIIFMEWLVLRKGDKKLIRMLHNKRLRILPFSLFKSFR
jgi:predicted Na+-dependent transporter